MADLIALPPLDMPPLTAGAAVLAAVDPGPIACIALFPGADPGGWPGLPFPAPGRFSAAGPARLVWTGRDQAHLIGIPVPPPGEADAAVTDQSDGWVCLSLTGAGAEDVLARLVPLDLSPPVFPPGSAARTMLNHMSLILWREDDGFRLMTFRSMARTAWHEIAAAMEMLAARAGVPR